MLVVIVPFTNLLDDEDQGWPELGLEGSGVWLACACDCLLGDEVYRVGTQAYA